MALLVSACTLPVEESVGDTPVAEQFSAEESFAMERVSALDVPYEPEQWLTRCQAACRGGTEAILAFCSTIPDFRLAAICRTLQFASETYCLNWCYWYFGP